MITIKFDIPKIENAIGKQARFALSHSINKTMTAVRKNQIAEMPNYMSNDPVRYTKSAPQVKYSSKKNLKASLYYGKRAEYMKKLINGGTVKAKGKRLIEPVNAKRKAGGQLGRNYIKSKLNTKSFFIGVPKGRPKNENYRGLWKRTGKGGLGKNGKARGKISLMVSFKRQSRLQDEQFPADKIAKFYFDRRFQRQWKVSLAKAMKSAR